MGCRELVYEANSSYYGSDADNVTVGSNGDFKESDYDLLSGLVDQNGTNLFSSVKEINKFMELGGDFEYASNLLSNGFSLDDILLFRRNSIMVIDESKPNALVVFPQDDYNHAFSINNLGHFLERINQEYNIFPFRALNEDQVYSAIESVENIELLVLFGHGTKTSLTLSNFGWASNPEIGKIDINDLELCPYLDLLSKEAVIFLGSCSNAEGREDAENLANMVINCAQGRTVYAAVSPFRPGSNIIINRVYPLELTIRSMLSFGNIDLTYTNQE